MLIPKHSLNLIHPLNLHLIYTVNNLTLHNQLLLIHFHHKLYKRDQPQYGNLRKEW